MNVRVVLLMLAVAAAGAMAADPTSTIPVGGAAPGDMRPDCGMRLLHADTTYETAYAWSYDGVVPPYYGAFAEGYDVSGQVCAVVCDLTGSGFQQETRMDVYVWNDDGGRPGQVLSMHPDTGLTAPTYPWFGRYVVPIEGAPCVFGTVWVGLWYAEPGYVAIWYVGADQDGPGGNPMTNIAPGLGYPTGWQDPSIVFGPTAAMGIGADVIPCDPVATRGKTWGEVKTLYR